MKKTFYALVLTTVACLAVFLFCSKNDTGSTGTGPSNTTPPTTPDESMTYTLSGNNIIMYSPARIDSYKYCNGTTLVANYDTSEAGYDTVAYTLTSNTLTVKGVGGSNGGNFTDPTAVVVYDMVFTRQGTGTSLVGSWKSSSQEYRLVSGTLTAAERQQLDSLIVAYNAEIAAGSYTELIITASKIDVYNHGSMDYNWVDNFLEMWNMGGPYSDSALFDIAVTKVSVSVIRLTGNKTAEVVTITYVEGVGEIYSSSTVANVKDTVYENPASCPNSPPAWFYTFQQANMRGIPKTAQGMDKPQLPYSVQQMIKHRSSGILW